MGGGWGRPGRRTWFETIEEMQLVLDQYLVGYNTRRPYEGRGIEGRAPLQASRDGIPKQSNEVPEAKLKLAA